jgi:hypothetical protein
MDVCGLSMAAHTAHIFVSDCTDRELVLPFGMALPVHVLCTVIAYMPGNLCQPCFGAIALTILSTGSLLRFWIRATYIVFYMCQAIYAHLAFEL